MCSMSTQTAEVVELCERLPEAKRAAVADFARFLVSQQDDERWEAILDDPRPRPRLEEFLCESAAEDRQHRLASACQPPR